MCWCDGRRNSDLRRDWPAPTVWVTWGGTRHSLVFPRADPHSSHHIQHYCDTPSSASLQSLFSSLSLSLSSLFLFSLWHLPCQIDTRVSFVFASFSSSFHWHYLFWLLLSALAITCLAHAIAPGYYFIAAVYVCCSLSNNVSGCLASSLLWPLGSFDLFSKYKTSDWVIRVSVTGRLVQWVSTCSLNSVEPGSIPCVGKNLSLLSLKAHIANFSPIALAQA